MFSSCGCEVLISLSVTAWDDPRWETMACSKSNLHDMISLLQEIISNSFYRFMSILTLAARKPRAVILVIIVLIWKAVSIKIAHFLLRTVTKYRQIQNYKVKFYIIVCYLNINKSSKASPCPCFSSAQNHYSSHCFKKLAVPFHLIIALNLRTTHPSNPGIQILLT